MEYELDKQYITEVTEGDLRDYIANLKRIDIGAESKEYYVSQLMGLFKHIKTYIFKRDIPNPFEEIEDHAFYLDDEGRLIDQSEYRRKKYDEIDDYIEFLLKAFGRYKRFKKNARKGQVYGIHLHSLNCLLTITIIFGTCKRRNEIRLLTWSDIYTKYDLIRKYDGMSLESLAKFSDSDRFIVHRAKPTENKKSDRVVASWLHPVIVQQLTELKFYYEERVQQEKNGQINNPNRVKNPVTEFPKYVFASSWSPGHRAPIGENHITTRFRIIRDENDDVKDLYPHGIRYAATRRGKELGLKVHEQEYCLAHKLIKIEREETEADGQRYERLYKTTRTREYYDVKELLDQINATWKWQTAFFGKKKLYNFVQYFLKGLNLKKTFYNHKDLFEDIRDRSKTCIRDFILDALLKVGWKKWINREEVIEKVISKARIEGYDFTESSVLTTMRLLKRAGIVSMKGRRFQPKLILLNSKSKWQKHKWIKTRKLPN